MAALCQEERDSSQTFGSPSVKAKDDRLPRRLVPASRTRQWLAIRSPVGISQTPEGGRRARLDHTIPGGSPSSLSIAATKELLSSGLGGGAQSRRRRRQQRRCASLPFSFSRSSLGAEAACRLSPPHQSPGGSGWPPLPGPAHDVKRKEMPSSYC